MDHNKAIIQHDFSQNQYYLSGPIEPHEKGTIDDFFEAFTSDEVDSFTLTQELVRAHLFSNYEERRCVTKASLDTMYEAPLILRSEKNPDNRTMSTYMLLANIGKYLLIDIYPLGPFVEPPLRAEEIKLYNEMAQ